MRTPALYNTHTANPAYHLRYTWTGWPLQGTIFTSMPPELLEDLREAWEGDGLRLLEYRWLPDKVQLLFSAVPIVSPVTLALRAKGRLDHALRRTRLNMPFSRKVGVRSLGDNLREEVEAYIERQVEAARFVDSRFTEAMRQFTVVNHIVDLSQPAWSSHGRYWYNLHIVLVVDGRCRIVDVKHLTTLRDGCLELAGKARHAISRLSIMPDHLHMAIRGQPIECPADIVSIYQNALSRLVGQRLWEDSYYVGTFSEYTMDAVRRLSQRS